MSNDDTTDGRGMLSSGGIPGRILHPEDVRILQGVYRRICAENHLAASKDVHRAFARYLLQMYFKGLVIEEKLYGFGVAAARARFQDHFQAPPLAPLQLRLRKVAIIEDNFCVAAELAGLFRDAGAVVVGPARREKDAMDLLESDVPDLAIVDLNLGSGPSFQIAEQLKAQSVPFCVLSGYCRSDLPYIPPSLDEVPWLEKPVRTDVLLRVAAAVLA